MTWVAERIFAAGGDSLARDWAGFQAQTGARAVVVVSAAPPPALDGPAPWALLWLPVADEPAYTLDHFRLGAAFMQTALQAGQAVLLLGPQGMHRVRPLFAAHQIASGQSLARVMREIQQKPWLPPYRGEAGLLEEWSGRKR